MTYSKQLSVIVISLIIMMTLAGGAGYMRSQAASRAEAETAPVPVTVPVTRGEIQQTVTAPGQVVGTGEVLLGMSGAGRLAEIKVRPGAVVQAGQVLALLDPEPFIEALAEARLNLALAQTEQEHQIAAAELDLKAAKGRYAQALGDIPNSEPAEAALLAEQAELDELLAGPNQDEITIAAAELRRSEANLRRAQQAYDQIAYTNDLGSRPEALQLEEATLDYEIKLAAYNLALREATEADIAGATARLRQAQSELQNAQAGLQTWQQELMILDIEIQQAQLTLARLQTGVDPLLQQAVEQARRDLAQATLAAPFDGIVLEVLARPGEQITPEAGFIRLADPAALEMRVKVIEEDLPLIKIGQIAELFFDAQPAEAVPGRVTRILPQRIQGEDRPLYYVYIAPDTLPGGIVSGMTVDAAIIIAQLRDVLRLPRALVQPNSQGIAVVHAWQNRQIARFEVLVGLRGDVYVEIIEGLTEGQQIVGE